MKTKNDRKRKRAAAVACTDLLDAWHIWWSQIFKPLVILPGPFAHFLGRCLLDLLTLKFDAVEFREMLGLHLRNLSLKAQVLQGKSVSIQLSLCGTCVRAGLPWLLVWCAFHDVLASDVLASNSMFGTKPYS
jgi:hypothetical protein